MKPTGSAATASGRLSAWDWSPPADVVPSRHVSEGGEVLVLGAGFSRAVSSHMPLTDELGRAALNHAGLDGDSRVPATGFGPEFTFEEWLSLLAEDQPYLSERHNRDNAALFSTLRESIGEVLASKAVAAADVTPPKWFYELLALIHYRRATVITFNYDTLVELGVATHNLRMPSEASLNSNPLTPDDVLMGQPPLPSPLISEVVRRPHSTFRLLKLHGSVDWWAVPDDRSGSTLNRERMEGKFGSYQPWDATRRRYLLPGRERFIVPPSTLKSAYYTNPLVRELWSEARDTMRRATRISFLGYSLPRADTVMTSLVESAIRGRAISFDIVNLTPDAPRARLLGLGAISYSVDEYSGINAVESFTRALTERASGELVEVLRRQSLSECAETQVLVSWGVPTPAQTGTRRVTSVLPPDASGFVELSLDEHPPVHGDATAARYGPDGMASSEVFASLRDLVLGVGLENVKGVAFRTGGQLVPLVTSWYENREIGASNRWIALSPAGRQPQIPWS